MRAAACQADADARIRTCAHAPPVHCRLRICAHAHLSNQRPQRSGRGPLPRAEAGLRLLRRALDAGATADLLAAGAIGACLLLLDGPGARGGAEATAAAGAAWRFWLPCRHPSRACPTDARQASPRYQSPSPAPLDPTGILLQLAKCGGPEAREAVARGKGAWPALNRWAAAAAAGDAAALAAAELLALLAGDAASAPALLKAAAAEGGAPWGAYAAALEGGGHGCVCWVARLVRGLVEQVGWGVGDCRL